MGGVKMSMETSDPSIRYCCEPRTALKNKEYLNTEHEKAQTQHLFSPGKPQSATFPTGHLLLGGNLGTSCLWFVNTTCNLAYKVIMSSTPSSYRNFLQTAK